MSRDDIIRMAREAGFNPQSLHMESRLASFAALVADAEAKRMFDEGMVTVGHMREQIGAEREACAVKAGEFARKWWSIHCASNKHMETTRNAHEDFCALQSAIRARGNT